MLWTVAPTLGLFMAPGRSAVTHPITVACCSMQPTPEEWRDFRARLVASEAAPDARSVTKQLQEEGLVLPEEDPRVGVWAHPVSFPEPGGLLCSQTLQGQLVFLARNRPAASQWAAELRKRLEAELPREEPRSEQRRVMTRWLGNTGYIYRLATRMANEVLARMGRTCVPAPSEKELWGMHTQALAVREQACLVLRAHGEECSGVALNKPLASRVDVPLASRLLYGREKANRVASRDDDPDDLAQRCAAAFGDGAAVYWGGPETQEEPALCLHSRSDIAGAEELSAGTGLFVQGSGVAMAPLIDAVLSGEVAPCSVRWFVGTHERLSTAEGAWLALACARPLVLKQPPSKNPSGTPADMLPLWQRQRLSHVSWHEAMELCGGEYGELSRLLRQENGKGGI